MEDPFAVLGVEPRFDLDMDRLHARFIELSARTHPDRFADPLEQAEATDRASRLNEAYRILTEPEKRADALLRLHGGPAREDDKSLPPDLLMQMMEVRERMEEAVASRDADELAELRQWAEDQRREHLARVAKLFDGGVTNDSAKAIRLELNALRYFERMIEQMPPPAE